MSEMQSTEPLFTPDQKRFIEYLIQEALIAYRPTEHRPTISPEHSGWSDPTTKDPILAALRHCREEVYRLLSREAANAPTFAGMTHASDSLSRSMDIIAKAIDANKNLRDYAESKEAHAQQWRDVAAGLGAGALGKVTRERNEALADIAKLKAERDELRNERNKALNELDKAVALCNSLRAELDAERAGLAETHDLAYEMASIRTAAEYDVLTERKRQRAKWGDKHDDDEHEDEALALVASNLAEGEPDPWGLGAKHPDRRARLVIASALLIAEIERLDRAALPTSERASVTCAPCIEHDHEEEEPKQ